jgi:trans-2,3-dihydro-3-hydroxyanthranilate isomerase
MRSAVRWVLIGVVALHGLIHLMGAAEGFGWADVDSLREPIGTGMAVAWLGAAALVVGSAVLLALQDRGGEPGAMAFGLEEQVGIVPCAVEVAGEGRGYARFRVPRLPEVWGEGLDAAQAAWALGLDPHEIGFDRHGPSRHSAGIPYDLVPVVSLDALARARVSADSFDKVFGQSTHPSVYVYARDGGGFRSRMFFPAPGLTEDPATGSAAASFAGALMQFEPLGDGEHHIAIRQGYEMGRPSEIELQIVIRGGALASAEIGGHAVVVSEGTLAL